MELLAFFWDLLVHLDRHLGELVAQFGPWVYAILFAIIFCETGLVVTPFLPGDSLLFVAGGLAALGGMNVHLLVVLLVAAAILGDAVNYAVGRYLGRHLFTDRASRFLNPRHLERAHAFYERHGGKAIVIARFVPIVRTYVPFVAGMAEMSYPRFAFYNVAGALLWVVSLCYAGYFFGNLPFVRQNLTLIIFGIIGVSLLPIVWAAVRARLDARA
ncbi:MAG TPA: DedA family protein [Usitatibacteraceae bacterium]|nr:DedA family protein [Usitatibacteraceae bacterium]HQY48355.1 DedA family protein [Usitatibacteraceae bacterium]